MIDGKIRLSCPACGWVNFEDPKVSVAAMILQDSKILLVQRSRNPHKDKWSFPAGFMDALEKPEEALKRECLEETGLDVNILDLLEVTGGRETPCSADILLIYRAKILSGQLKAGDDAQDAAFFDLNALPELAFTSTIETIKKHLNSPIQK